MAVINFFIGLCHYTPTLSLFSPPFPPSLPFSVSRYLFSPSSRPQVLASGDASGVVKVWRLGSHLTSQVTGEAEQLASLADSTLHAASL